MPASNEHKLRIFTGIAVPAEITGVLDGLRSSVRAEAAGLRWTPAEKLHLTLTFLGSIQAAIIPTLAEGLAAVQSPSPELLITGVDFFSGAGVLVLEMASTPALLALQQQVEAACERIGYRKEARPYRPHITLARQLRSAAKIRAVEARTLVQEMKTALSSLPPLRSRADAYTLFESRGGQYLPLRQFALSD